MPEAAAVGRRKQTDQSERRSESVGFQVTPSERAELDERAAAAGVTLSEYVRAAALGYRLTAKDPLREKALFELSAIGNNLNQLARHANMTEQIDPQELQNAMRLWREVVERLHA
jgi:uncharacterized protein (DUF1778 family)